MNQYFNIPSQVGKNTYMQTIFFHLSYFDLL